MLSSRAAVLRAAVRAHARVASAAVAPTVASASFSTSRAVGAREAKATPASASASASAAAGGVDKSTLSPVRGMFYGDLTSYAKHCVPYPCALNEEAKSTLAAMLEPVASYFASVPSADIDANSKIPDEVMRGLAELGLFGLQIPEELGGLGLSNTAYARLAEEMVMDPSIAVTLMAHQSIGLKGILLFGNEEQKRKYLPPLASGEQLAAFALTEPTTGSDAAGIKLTATPTPDGKGFLLNGQKMWISNGGICKVYTLFARTPAEDGKSKMTAFIVHRDESSGITPGPPEKKLGIRGSNTTVVNFDNCFVPMENVLGGVNNGFKVAMGILNNGRFGMGAATAGGIRKLIALAADYANNRPQFGKPIAEYGLIREKFARMAVDAYAAESMAYMTTALIDGPGLDMSVEAAICKIYGSEAMFRAINDCIQVLGGMGFSAGGAYPFERLLRDSRILLIFEGTNEILRLFIALTCLQGPGAELKALGDALKSPASALAALPDLLTTYARQNFELGLHPVPGVASQLSAEAAAVSAGVNRFQAGLQKLLMRHGRGIVEQQLALQRVADCAIDLYACLAVLSRTSQTIAKGGEGVEHECVLARSFIRAALERVTRNAAGMRASAAKNGDADTLRIATDVLAAGKCLASHPIGV